MKDIKIYVAGGDIGYMNWCVAARAARVSEADIIMFTGGTDINPSMYGKKRHPQTQNPDIVRDALEKELFEMAVAMRIPMIGICRGAQFLCAMNGGILVQHQNHPASHEIETYDGRKIKVSSDHHQRMWPWVKGCEHKLLGWCDKLSPFSEGETPEDKMDGNPEAEIVYFPEFRCLGIQCHPEWLYPLRDQETYDAITYFRKLTDRLISKMI